MTSLGDGDLFVVRTLLGTFICTSVITAEGLGARCCAGHRRGQEVNESQPPGPQGLCRRVGGHMHDTGCREGCHGLSPVPRLLLQRIREERPGGVECELKLPELENRTV